MQCTIIKEGIHFVIDKDSQGNFYGWVGVKLKRMMEDNKSLYDGNVVIFMDENC